MRNQQYIQSPMASKIYFDGAASSPVYHAVLEKMNVISRDYFSNPSSIYETGREAKQIVEYCRAQLASLLQATEHEIAFVSGATEANNWAIFSLWKKRRPKSVKILFDPTAHASVIMPLQVLALSGAELVPFKIDPSGVICHENFESLAREGAFCVLNWVNNETGIVHPVQVLAKMLKNINAEMPVHVDAVQAFTKIKECVFYEELDSMSVSAHKINGPRGAGILMTRPHLKLPPFIYGGGQEMGLRGGSENIAAMAGFTLAAHISMEGISKSIEEKLQFQSQIEEAILTAFPKAVVHAKSQCRSAFISYISIPPFPGEVTLRMLDSHGVCVSTGSACHQNSKKKSHVLKAMGVSEDLVRSSIRVSFHHLLKASEFNEGKKRLMAGLNELKKEMGAI